MYGESSGIFALLIPVIVWPLLVAVPLGAVLYLWRPRLAPFAIAAGMMMAIVGLHGSWQPVPRQALDWMFWAVLLPPLASLIRPMQPLAQALASVLGLAVVGWVLWARMPFSHQLLWLVCALAYAILMQLAWDKTGKARFNELGLMLSSALLAVATALGGSILIGQVIGALTAITVALMFLPILRGNAPVLSAPLLAVSLSVLLMLAGYAYAFVDVPLLAISGAVVLPMLATSQRSKPLLAIILLAIGLGLMAWQLWPQSNAYGY
ncbi:hypothetical protein ACKC9G_03960 [Pokkaliibacter sp. CJK22405]|uniref:hypothetical protein n=1 Tax=Pokkaliibacter sp. CJK22405 TaxID=3384615 RepID=UPI00398520CC